MSAVVISYESVVAALDEIVAEQGADYVYESPTGGSCVYANDDGTGSCLIGHYFEKIGVLEKIEDAGLNYEGSDAVLDYLVEQGIVAFEDADPEGGDATPVKHLLGSSQNSQDCSVAWGEAVEYAKSTEKGKRGGYLRKYYNAGTQQYEIIQSNTGDPNSI